MQSVSSRIWTRVAVSISYDDNHYTTILIYTQLFASQSARAEEYTECISTERQDPPPLPTSVLDMTLNNLMVKL